MAKELHVHYLIRQRWPARAPQALQILSSAAALADAGARVYLPMDRPLEGIPPSREHLLAAYGLEDPGEDRLRLIPLLSARRTPAGAEFRSRFIVGLLRDWASGGQPVLLSRHFSYSAASLRLIRALRLPFPLVFEWHYAPSLNALEAGRKDEAARLSRIERRIAAWADGHVAVSRHMADWLRDNRMPRGPVAVIPNGGPTPRGQRDIDGSTREPRVVYAGLFRRSADFDLIVRAARYLGPEVRIEVFGRDEEGRVWRELRERIRAQGLSNRVRLRGHLPPSELRATLRSARVALAVFADIVDRRMAGCPLKILEYHAAGIPVVSTDHPVIHELIEDGESGLLVPHDDPRALARAIHRLLDDRALAARLSRKGLERAASASWKRRGERLAQWLRTIRDARRVLRP